MIDCSAEHHPHSLRGVPFGRRMKPQHVCMIDPHIFGGTLFAAAVALHAALQNYRQQLGPGEFATVALIASDRRQARQALNYVKGLIEGSGASGGTIPCLFAGSPAATLVGEGKLSETKHLPVIASR
jgi:hypothetical protein